MRLVAAGAALRRAGGDVRHHGRGDRRRRREHDPRADGPMGRFGQPEELVGTAIWLASDASRFVTGVVTPVDSYNFV